MASIDKLFGSMAQFHELYNWLKDNNKSLLNSLYLDINDPPPDDNSSEFTIANFSRHEDEWLYTHCPLVFVKQRIKEQYSKRTLFKWNFIYYLCKVWK